jgi:hypothetical protein
MTTTTYMRTGDAVKLNPASFRKERTGRIVSVPNDFDPFVIVVLDEGFWNEGKDIYICHIVAHPDSLIPTPIGVNTT